VRHAPPPRSRERVMPVPLNMPARPSPRPVRRMRLRHPDARASAVSRPPPSLGRARTNRSALGGIDTGRSGRVHELHRLLRNCPDTRAPHQPAVRRLISDPQDAQRRSAAWAPYVKRSLRQTATGRDTARDDPIDTPWRQFRLHASRGGREVSEATSCPEPSGKARSTGYHHPHQAIHGNRGRTSPSTCPQEGWGTHRFQRVCREEDVRSRQQIAGV
jgi:hypothetical protein